MTEQRFNIVHISRNTVIGKVSKSTITDTETYAQYTSDDIDAMDDLCDLLNEQQVTIIGLQEIIIDLKDNKNQLHKVISKLGQEVAELKTKNAVLSSKLNQIPKSIKGVWLE